MKIFRDRCGLPLFNTARGTADTTLLLSPPFVFPGVTARFFPLRANLNILRTFYNGYLNVASEICTFKPYVPWVFLVVLDYGRMAAEETNLGWVSQHEIFFAVPLGEWIREPPGGRPIFKGWVLDTPFIYVDNAASLITGREVYGWPKVLSRLRKTRGKWLTDPSGSTRLLSLDVLGFGSKLSGAIRLLDIDQRLSQNMSLAPLDLNAVDPFKRLSRWNSVAWSAGLDLAQLVVRAPLSGFGPGNAPAEHEVLLDSLRQLFSFYREPGVNVVTHKQFPGAYDPALICYESLVKSRLGVARYNRGGLLGLPNILQGEVNGGFHIRLHHHSSFPIVESLGLEVARERTIDKHTVSILEPVFPFWLDVDLKYGKGKAICWRMPGHPWYRKRAPVPHSRRIATYDTFAGAGQQVWCGPFFLPRASWSVFPLRAHEETLHKFVDHYLNIGEPYHFKSWGSYVYMVVSTGRMFSQERSAAWIDSNQVAFVIPLLWYKGKELKGLIATQPFSFCDNPTLTTSQREVQGFPTMDATITAAPRFWPRKGQPMLNLQLDVFTALDEGLKSKRRTLLEVVRRAPSHRCGPPPPCDPSGLRDLALLIADEVPLQMLTLKQFRDSDDPALACYQSLVLEPWTLSKPKRFKPFRPGVAVKIFQYPSIPLVKKLGLIPDFVVPPKVAKEAIADVFCPDRAFRIESTVHIGLAEVLSRTAGFLPWEARPIKPPKLPIRFEKIRDFESSVLYSGGPQMLVRALVDPCGSPGPGEMDATTKSDVSSAQTTTASRRRP